MSDDNEELTFGFADDDKEYKVSDLSEEHRLVYDKVMLINRHSCKALQQLTQRSC